MQGFLQPTLETTESKIFIPFRIVGGDVCANWFLGVICDKSPSIVPLALGFEADIASSLGWVKICIYQIVEASTPYLISQFTI